MKINKSITALGLLLLCFNSHCLDQYGSFKNTTLTAQNIELNIDKDIIIDEKSYFLGGHGVGNGGDFVRANFIKYGQTIVNFLLNHPYGVAFSEEHKLNAYALESILSTKIIKVSKSKLIDNQEELVDAIYKDGFLFLYEETWQEFLKSNTDSFIIMIFHEMLRASNFNDDNFKISKHLKLPSQVDREELIPTKSFLEVYDGRHPRRGLLGNPKEKLGKIRNPHLFFKAEGFDSELGIFCYKGSEGLIRTISGGFIKVNLSNNDCYDLINSILFGDASNKTLLILDNKTVTDFKYKLL